MALETMSFTTLCTVWVLYYWTGGGYSSFPFALEKSMYLSTTDTARYLGHHQEIFHMSLEQIVKYIRVCYLSK